MRNPILIVIISIYFIISSICSSQLFNNSLLVIKSETEHILTFDSFKEKQKNELIEKMKNI